MFCGWSLVVCLAGGRGPRGWGWGWGWGWGRQPGTESRAGRSLKPHPYLESRPSTWLRFPKSRPEKALCWAFGSPASAHRPSPPAAPPSRPRGPAELGFLARPALSSSLCRCAVPTGAQVGPGVGRVRAACGARIPVPGGTGPAP